MSVFLRYNFQGFFKNFKKHSIHFRKHEAIYLDETSQPKFYWLEYVQRQEREGVNRIIYRQLPNCKYIYGKIGIYKTKRDKNSIFLNKIMNSNNNFLFKFIINLLISVFMTNISTKPKI